MFERGDAHDATPTARIFARTFTMRRFFARFVEVKVTADQPFADMVDKSLPRRGRSNEDEKLVANALAPANFRRYTLATRAAEQAVRWGA